MSRATSIPDRIPGEPGSAFLLRRLRPEDLDTLVAYRSEPGVARYQSWNVDWSLEDARALFDADRQVADPRQSAWIQWMIEEVATGEVCGDVAMHFGAGERDTVEVGVTLAPQRQGQGIAQAALRILLRWLFDELACHRVFAQADHRNEAVRRLFARLGFRLEATHVEAEWFKGGWATLCIYAILKREWGLSR